MYVDSHAHLTTDLLFPQIDILLERAKEAGVSHVFNICTDILTLSRGLELHKKYPWVHNVASTTPHEVDNLGEKDFKQMETAAKEGHLVAVGETGLDYHYSYSSPEKQKEFLIRYSNLAKNCNLPLVIHCREAFDDLFTILDKENQSQVLIHCFTGNLKEAKEGIKRGWMFSFSGIVTFKKSVELQEVARFIPLEHIMIETDSPYLSPQTKRGKTNEPSFLPETVEMIAKLKKIPMREVANITSQNALNFFKVI